MHCTALQENIGQFGGDPGSVTMMGHGTGAALTGLLLLSPVSQVLLPPFPCWEF